VVVVVGGTVVVVVGGTVVVVVGGTVVVVVGGTVVLVVGGTVVHHPPIWPHTKLAPSHDESTASSSDGGT
jgi:hypothetical protein